MNADADTITIIRARNRRLAKLIHADGGVENYDSARTFDLFTRAVFDLEAVAALLDELLDRPDIAVVRGAVIDPAHVRGVRRLVYPDRATGEAPTLQDVPHHWLALDVEGVERPTNVSAADIAACAALARQRLPEAFRAGQCLAQASASHGVKPGVRLRLWYWLDRPTTGAELKRWLRGSCADPSVFRPAQLIYTAAPAFVGRVDHLPNRLMMLGGAPAVAVPSPASLTPPPSRPLCPIMRPDASGAQRYAFAALAAAAARIAFASEGGRHAALVSQARSLARLIDAGLLTESEVTRTLGDAIEHAGKHRDEAVAVLTWAMQHPASGFIPEARA